MREFFYDRLFLFAGLNQDAIDDDEANGGGLNTVVDTPMFDALEVEIPLVASEEFWQACVDATIPREKRHVDVPREKTKIRVR
jgi:hypothetical protein